MDRKISVTIRALSLLVLAYGIIVSFVAIGGIKFYSSDLFRDIPKLLLVVLLLSLNVLCAFGGAGLFLLKKWGRALLAVSCPLIVVTYLLLFITEAISIDAAGIILVMMPALFLYIFSIEKIKAGLK